LPDAGVIENSLDYAGWDMGSFGLPGIFDPVPETAGVGEGANVSEPVSIVRNDTGQLAFDVLERIGELEDFKSMYPAENYIYNEYIKNLRNSFNYDLVTYDVRYIEAGFRNFDEYVRNRSLELFDENAEELAEILYGPDIGSLFPGKMGDIARVISSGKDAMDTNDALNMVSELDELLNLHSYGPKFINEGLYIELFGKPYGLELR